MSAAAKKIPPATLKAGQVWKPKDAKVAPRRIQRIVGAEVSYRSLGSLIGKTDQDGKCRRDRFQRFIRDDEAVLVQTPSADTPSPAPKVQSATQGGSSTAGQQEEESEMPWEPGDPQSES